MKNTQAEIEANWFAAALLMPASLLSKDYVEYEGNVEQLAAKYEVKISVMETRLKYLEIDGLIKIIK